jgi:pimeloyl-ACP methyl ester carboxylesterase
MKMKRSDHTPRRSRTTRSLFTGLVIVAVGLLSLPVALAQASPGSSPSVDASNNPQWATELTKPTIVLVHGAWADSGSWSKVVRRLQDDGYTVDAFPNPLRGLASDAAYLRSFVQTITGPVVLVGHSYGGSVITNAAVGLSKVKALVYVNAYIPATGETVLQLATTVPGSCLSGGGDPTKVFNLVPYPGAAEGDFDLYAKQNADDPYPGFARCFANDLPRTEAAILASTQRPVTLSALSEHSGIPGWKTIPSWALVGTIDHVIPPTQQLAMARRADAHISRVKASHLSMISRPAVVTNFILTAVEGVT